MRKLLVLLMIPLMTLAIAATAQGGGMRVLYHQYDFYVPENPVLTAYLGSDSENFAVKYSEEQGKKYIAFNREIGFKTGGCPLATFFNQVLNDKDQGCGAGAIKSFQAVFVNDRESGQWSGDEHHFFYFLSPRLSTVFVISDETGSELYKIESDYLDKAGIKAIFSEYL